MAKIDLLTLLMPYGTHAIKVKAKGTGYTTSDFSNTVSYTSRPKIVQKDDATVTVSNCRAAASSYSVYDANDTLIATESYSGQDGGTLDIDISSAGWADKTFHPIYVKCTVSGTDHLSNTITFIVGNPILGVSGMYQSDPALTRTDDAVGLTWTMTNNLITSDFDDIFPFNLMQRVTIDGNVFVYVPEMYWRIGLDSSNRITDVAVAPREITTLGDGQISAHSEAFYYGAYGASMDGDKLCSKSGVARQYSKTLAQFRTAARANGASKYDIIDLYHTRILELLFCIEFATKNSDSVMQGYTSYGQTCGATDTLTKPSGQLSSGGRMRWHYIEDFVGNGLEFFDGVYGMYATTNRDNYSESNTGKTQFSGTNLTSGYELSALAIEDATDPFRITPKEATSNSSYNTYFCDQVYCASGAYVYCRGRYSSGTFYGLFYWICSSASGTNDGIGSRLIKTL